MPDWTFDAAHQNGYRSAAFSDSSGQSMSETTLLIKRMPSELKQWLADEAARNKRSMNKEVIRLVEKARALRAAAARPAKDPQTIARIVQDLQAMPVLDTRRMDDALYDPAGMPR
jgi:Arc-like DNA binding domain